MLDIQYPLRPSDMGLWCRNQAEIEPRVISCDGDAVIYPAWVPPSLSSLSHKTKQDYLYSILEYHRHLSGRLVFTDNNFV
jgi:hypothetical protein